MARLLVLLVLLALVVWLAVVVARRLRADGGAARPAAPWRLEERSAGEHVEVRAVRAGERPLLVGAVRFGDPDFEGRIEELRAEGEAKLVALNAPLRRLGR